MAECLNCGRAADTGNLCAACAKEYERRLRWLRIGMPALRQVAYRQVTITPHTGRARPASAVAPLRMDAEQAYGDVERDLQVLGARVGLGPVGRDGLGRARVLREWSWLLPRLIVRVAVLCACDEAGEDLRMLIGDCERVAGFVERPAERRLVGVCPECLMACGGDGEPVRTPVYAAAGERYGVCPACGAWLDLRRVRLAYLESLGMLHITRTRADAARWLSEQAGVRVTGKMLDNWRLAGRLHPRHVEGRYWEWDVRELLECVR